MCLLSAIGFLSGFLNAIAGGGGLITLPILLWVGMPPLQALATNKFQSVFGTLSSSLNFFNKGLIDIKLLAPALLIAVIFSALGTWWVQQVPNQQLQLLLPYFLIAIALYSWLSPAMNDKPQTNKQTKPKRFAILCGVIIGLYGGFFGPGLGAIATILIASLLGYNLKSATAHGKPLVLISNTTSLLIFMLAGHVVWFAGLCMAVTQIIGARVGSNLVIAKGSAMIRPLLFFSTIAIAIKLLISPIGS